MRWLACLLAVGLVLGAVMSSGARADPPAPDAGSARVEPSPDGGTALSAEDQEVVANLDLLEHLDEARHLDLLMALSDEPDGGAP